MVYSLFFCFEFEDYEKNTPGRNLAFRTFDLAPSFVLACHIVTLIFRFVPSSPDSVRQYSFFIHTCHKTIVSYFILYRIFRSFFCEARFEFLICLFSTYVSAIQSNLIRGMDIWSWDATPLT